MAVPAGGVGEAHEASPKVDLAIGSQCSDDCGYGLKGLHNDERGQGLVEYLLIVALVALAATAGMSSAASYINSAFIRIGQKLGGYIS